MRTIKNAVAQGVDLCDKIVTGGVLMKGVRRFLSNYAPKQDLFILTNEDLKKVFAAGIDQGVRATSTLLDFDSEDDCPDSVEASEKCMKEIFSEK